MVPAIIIKFFSYPPYLFEDVRKSQRHIVWLNCYLYMFSYWHNWWCGDRSLKQCFPVLFSIVRSKDMMVVDNLIFHNGVIQ
jgi:hypothetical protein